MQNDLIPVSTLGEYLKRVLESETLLYRIKIFGEVSSFNVSGGNGYFVIKDENAIMNCVLFDCFKFVIPKIGDKIIVTGTPRYYVKGGKLSFNAEKIEEFGKGDLYSEFIKLKNKLELEGLFDIEHKKSLPKSIKKIGVVTAENGAVIHDIMNVAKRRNPNVEIILFSTKVQGIGAEYEIAKGIDFFSNSDVDAIIVGRGGGSAEDLSPYNTEIVARATYNCNKFLVSAVGHETDFTIIDFVADLRAPTPSAAAELLVNEVVNLKEKINNLEEQLCLKMKNIINHNFNILNNQLNSIHYEMKRIISYNSNKLEILINDLSNKNPATILNKGYIKAYKDDIALSSVKTIELKDNLKLIFKDGNIDVEVLNINGKF